MDKDEVIKTVSPPKGIACEDCLHRLKPLHGIPRHDYAVCKVYKEPGHKPNRVVWHGDDCDYYERDPDYAE